MWISKGLKFHTRYLNPTLKDMIFFTKWEFQELLDLITRNCFWNGPLECSCGVLIGLTVYHLGKWSNSLSVLKSVKQYQIQMRTQQFLHLSTLLWGTYIAIDCYFIGFIWQMVYFRLSKAIILLMINKANMRDLIAATGLVILIKLDSNHWFFSQYGIEIR